jgi:alternate signal-mediated exported protein
MNKKLTGLVAGAAGAALLLSGGTYALWNDSAETPGGTITAGNLDVAAVGTPTWQDVSADREDAPHVIDLTTFKIVPGDTITGTYGFDLGLQGDNMLAELALTGDALSGALADGLEATYTLKQGTTVIGTATGTLGSGIVTQLASADNSGDTTGALAVPAAVDGTADVTLEVSVTFDEDTDERELVQTSAALAASAATLTQVREDAPGFN